MSGARSYPVKCWCGWPFWVTTGFIGLSFEMEFRTGGINGRAVQRCPNPECRGVLPLSLRIDDKDEREQAA